MAKHESERKKFSSNLWVRIVCGILAFLMVAGTLLAVIFAMFD